MERPAGGRDRDTNGGRARRRGGRAHPPAAANR